MCFSTLFYPRRRAVAGEAFATGRAGLVEGVTFQREASEGMLGTGALDVPVSEGAAERISDRYRAIFARFQTELEAYYAATVARRDAESAYRLASTALLAEIKHFEEAGDGAMEAEAAVAAAGKRSNAVFTAGLGLSFVHI